MTIDNPMKEPTFETEPVLAVFTTKHDGDTFKDARTVKRDDGFHYVHVSEALGFISKFVHAIKSADELMKYAKKNGVPLGQGYDVPYRMYYCGDALNYELTIFPDRTVMVSFIGKKEEEK